MNREKPNRNMVAQLAGVSSATVSRVYNHPESVSPEARMRVTAAADKLGYTPDKTASSLRRSGSGQIALIELRKEQRPYYWNSLPVFKWFFADVLHGVKSVIDSSMYQLNIDSIGNSGDIDRIKRSYDGIICFDVDRPEEARLIAESGIPHIIGHHTSGFTGCSRCSTDNFAGGRMQAELLLSKGAVRPLYITGYTEKVESHRKRLEGFLSVFGRDRIQITDTETGRAAGYRAVRESLAEPDHRFDAVATVNDLTAVGAGYALMDAGIGVQTDIPLAGYDNMPFQQVLPFSLPSIDIRPRELYRRAAELLLERMKNGDREETNIIFPPSPSNTQNSF